MGRSLDCETAVEWEVSVDNRLIILTGPTAVGKTGLSIRLAKAVGGEIISADSMQVYKGMDIGTAKIRPDEMDGVRHYLIDELEPTQEFNVNIFKCLAKSAIKKIQDNGNVPIIVGGTGFYIQAVLYDIDFEETAAKQKDGDDYRRYLQGIATAGDGSERLYQMLRQVDPASCGTIHQNNVKRVIRALEFYHDTGKPISLHNQEQRQKTSPYDYHYYVLNDHRDRLYDRINRRVDEMLQDGLLDEVRRLKASGLDKSLVSMQGIGYKEMLAYLDGECGLDDAVDLIKQNSRHYAKRQITWFKRERSVEWVNLWEYGYDMDAILGHMVRNEVYGE